MVSFDQQEIRQNLSKWFQNNGNATAQVQAASPYDQIIFLPTVDDMQPVEGWRELLRRCDWKFWGGELLKKDYGL